jgi:hypothetical protein
LAEADVPKPGAVVHGRVRDLIRSWPNLTVSGIHFVHEDSPDEIDTAVAQFMRKLRSAWQDARAFHGTGRRRLANRDQERSPSAPYQSGPRLSRSGWPASICS